MATNKASAITSKNTIIITVGSLIVLAVCAAAIYMPRHQPTPSANPTPSTSPAASASSNAPAPTPANQASTTAASIVRCQSMDLTASISAANGAAGTSYQNVVLTNHTNHTCTVTGFPGISLVDAGNNVLGQPATRNGAAGATVTLAPNTSAAATIALPNPANFASGTCSAMSTNLRIYPPDDTTWLSLAFKAQWCPGFSVETLVKN